MEYYTSMGTVFLPAILVNHAGMMLQKKIQPQNNIYVEYVYIQRQAKLIYRVSHQDSGYLVGVDGSGSEETTEKF